MAPPAESPRPPGILATLREALRGGHGDLTEGPVGRAVVLLAVPMVLEMALESVFAVVDVFWVGKLGASAVATVGLTESILSILYSIAIGLSTAATATVARRIGERDRERAARTAVQAIALGLAIAVPLGVLGALSASRILAFMGAGPDVVASGSRFMAVMLGGNVVIVLLFLINAIFRGAGDATVAMRVLWFANAVNLVLDPCLIFGLGPFPRLGVTGAAVATTTGRGLAVLLQVATLARGTGRIAIRREHLALDPRTMLALLKLSGAAIVQSLVATASWIGLVRILAGFGSAALAGYTIAIRIVVFAILPAWGMSNAAATLVGQNLGAGRPERAERSVALAGLYNMAFLGAVGLSFVVLARPLVALFSTDPAVLPVGALGLRVIAAGFPFFAWGLVLSGALNGAGDTWTPTVVNLLVFWLLEIPLAWLLAARAGFGPKGVFLAVALGFSAYAALGALFFRRGKWKERKV
ncbi:MAG TPA: MATE family efflux transporter [Thermoanaerobaculia bacterium]|nr:MATE family efflux transporter [Thermoanaerobaculia bacterium]